MNSQPKCDSIPNASNKKLSIFMLLENLLHSLFLRDNGYLQRYYTKVTTLYK